jgi:hypothetical protein
MRFSFVLLLKQDVLKSMRILLGMLVIGMSFDAAAQTSAAESSSRFISLSGGRSTHGTGDMKGVSQKVTYGKFFRKKLYWFSAIGADIHDGEYFISTTQPDGRVLDHSFRYTSGAIQITGGAGWCFVKTNRTEAGINVGGFLRYQSSSYFDQLSIVFDPQRIGPYPATFILNTSPQRTYSVGAGPEAFYRQTIFKSIFAGLSAGFQVDTNGDVLTNISISVGKRLK